MKRESEEGLTRRSVLRLVPFLALAVPLTGVFPQERTFAQGKVSKESADYQDKPKGDQMCSNCAHFVPPAACVVVAGEISPQGWTKYWAPKKR